MEILSYTFVVTKLSLRQTIKILELFWEKIKTHSSRHGVNHKINSINLQQIKTEPERESF